MSAAKRTGIPLVDGLNRHAEQHKAARPHEKTALAKRTPEELQAENNRLVALVESAAESLSDIADDAERGTAHPPGKVQRAALSMAAAEVRGVRDALRAAASAAETPANRQPLRPTMKTRCDSCGRGPGSVHADDCKATIAALTGSTPQPRSKP